MSEQICQQCGGHKAISYEIAPSYRNGLIGTIELCMCPPKHHDGDLGHNAMVSIDSCRYSGDDGSTFYLEEVLISDKMRHLYLTPGEALSLLDWLTQEKAKLLRLVEANRD